MTITVDRRRTRNSGTPYPCQGAAWGQGGCVRAFDRLASHPVRSLPWASAPASLGTLRTPLRSFRCGRCCTCLEGLSGHRCHPRTAERCDRRSYSALGTYSRLALPVVPGTVGCAISARVFGLVTCLAMSSYVAARAQGFKARATSLCLKLRALARRQRALARLHQSLRRPLRSHSRPCRQRWRASPCQRQSWRRRLGSW
jgi:hypothetical protein